MNKYLIAALAIAASGAVMAQDKPYATLTQTEGLSTVSLDNQLTNGANGMPLKQGSQLVTSANGNAMVEFASGCSVKIGPGQTLKIEDAECRALLASRAAPVTGASAVTPLNVALAVGGTTLLYEVTKSDKKTTVATTPPAPVKPLPVPPKPIKPPISRS